MICFLGNCQAQELSKSPVFADLNVKWLLYRILALHNGPGFRPAQQTLAEAFPEVSLVRLRESGMLTAQPSRGDVACLEPTALVVTMFHEATELVDEQTGAVYNMMDCQLLQRTFPEVRKVMLARCRRVDPPPLTYPERFVAFIRDLRSAFDCPVVVTLRLRHWAFITPTPCCRLRGWNLIGDRVRAFMEEAAGSDPGIRLVDMDRIAAGRWNVEGSLDAISETIVPGEISCGGGIGFSISRDMEHCDPAMARRAAELVRQVLSGKAAAYGEAERIPEVWQAPGGEQAAPRLEDIAENLKSSLLRRQHRGLLELLSFSPSAAGGLLAQSLDGLRLHVTSLEILVCHLAVLPFEEASALAKRTVERLATEFPESDPQNRLLKTAMADKLIQLATQLREKKMLEQAAHCLDLADQFTPDEEAVSLARIALLLADGACPAALSASRRFQAGHANQKLDCALALAGLWERAGEASEFCGVLTPWADAGEPEAVRPLVVALRANGRPDLALSRLEAFAGTCGKPWPAWVQRERVTTLYAMGNGAEARSALRQLASGDVEDALESWPKGEGAYLPATPGRALVVRASPLIVVDVLVAMLTEAGWAVEILVGADSAPQAQATAAPAKPREICHVRPSGRYVHALHRPELPCVLFDAPYGLAVLAMAVWDPEDYRDFLELLAEIPAALRVGYCFDQLISPSWRDRFLTLPPLRRGDA